MFCSNCGKTLREGAKFCSHCGTPVEVLDTGDTSAPDMAAKAETPMLETTALLTETESVISAPAEDAVSAQTVPPVSAKDFIPGAELYKFKMVEKTMGTSSVATRLGSGTLHVYDNGLKFSSILGANVGSGMLRTVTSVAINIAEGLYDPNTYPLDQIQGLSVGKRMGVYNTLGDWEQVHIDGGELLLIGPNGGQQRSSFEFSDPMSFYGLGYWELGCCPTYRNSREDYTRALKSVAGAFGISPGQIDRLLELGAYPTS